MFEKLFAYSRPQDVLWFARLKEELDDTPWNYIILGKTGPTGKTYLWTLLRNNGFNAIEITENIYPWVEYNDDTNHFLVDEFRKQVVIVLNRPLKKTGNRYTW